MTEPVLHHVVCPGLAAAAAEGVPEAGHRMAYWQWGDPRHPRVLVCVHGLSRQGRDFDTLARALAPHMRVVCPDVVGRGHSDWLADPLGYQFPTYVADMLALLAQLHGQAPLQSLDWVGTSMGGLIGMMIAGYPGLPLPAPVRKLVLNDVGPVVQWEALQRIGTYLGRSGRFGTLQEAADAMWAVSTGFGPHTAAQWLDLSRHMVRAAEPGNPGAGLALHYDPRIALPLAALTQEAALQGEAGLWQVYDQIRADTLLLRGSDSDLLSPATAATMTERGPRARLAVLSGVGHAPTLVVDAQVRLVREFLGDA